MRYHQRGIALVESLIAVLLLAIGLLGVVGLQARSYSAMSEASMRAEATIATDRLLGIMSNDQANLAAYALAPGGTPSTRLQKWYDDTRSTIPQASITIAIAPTAGTNRSKVDVTIGWTRKAGGPTNQHKLTSYISP